LLILKTGPDRAKSIAEPAASSRTTVIQPGADPLHNCEPQAQGIARPAASPSLRAGGEAIYPSTDAPLDGFTSFAMTVWV
jgi:hypothetical protein